jgi:hypothetical protein
LIAVKKSRAALRMPEGRADAEGRQFIIDDWIGLSVIATRPE